MLPAPTPDAFAHSQRVNAHLRALIEAAGGWMPFSRFMEAALYAPGLGYYAAGAMKFGAAGDFVTAPELTPLFGRTLAHAIAPALTETGGEVLELGAGSGRLAVDMLGELQRLGALPARYSILEVSADLRARQQELLGRELPQLADRVQWLDALPEHFIGVILGNEVLDALRVVNADMDIKVLIITGAGKGFQAGADIRELNRMGIVEILRWNEGFLRVNANIEKLRQPVIAAINGLALGGGLELALACSIRSWLLRMSTICESRRKPCWTRSLPSLSPV